MPSTHFLLARYLSPQTRWGPNDIPGGLPEITQEDVRQALGFIKDTVSWLCLDAKWLASERSLRALLNATESHSWRAWRDEKQRSRIDVFTHGLLAELAVLDWIDPNAERSIRGRAAYAECSPKTYNANYAGHVNAVANWLQEKEIAGLREVRGAFRESA